MSTGFAGGVKFSYVQVTSSRTTTGTMYTVPSGKTFIGSYCLDPNGTANVASQLTVDGTVVASVKDVNGQNGFCANGPLYVNEGVAIACVIASAGPRVSICGILEENQ